MEAAPPSANSWAPDESRTASSRSAHGGAGRRGPSAELLASDTETLRRIGLSRAKTAYLRDLAERLSDGRLDLERLQNLDDDYCEPIRAC